MSYADIALIIFVGGFTLSGLYFGLFRTLGSLVGTIIAAVFTGRVIDVLQWKFGFLFGGGEISRVVIYIIVFLLLSRLIGLLFWILGKFLGIVSWLPFVKSINHILGALLGFLQGIILAGFIVLYASHVLPPIVLEQTQIEQSGFAKYVLVTMKTLELMFPESVRDFILTTAATASKAIPVNK